MVPIVYWWATYTLRGVAWLVVRWEAKGRERVPMEGPLIVACNHLNNADPAFVGAGLARRRVRYMAKVELFKFPFGVIPRLYGAFPVRRFDADVGALLAAERILRQDGALGMFPEGTRSRTGYIGQPHPGTAMIALRSGATVLPCALTGTEVLKNPLNVLRRPLITFTVGDPIQVERVRKPTEEQVTQLTQQIFSAITAMLPPRYLAPYTETQGAEAAEDGGDRPGE
jgi:1-acyl-sn-glycerol-3-phosphate acyltransferase